MRAIVGLLLLFTGAASSLEIGRGLACGPASGELGFARNSGAWQATLPSGFALRLPRADAGGGISPPSAVASPILRRPETTVSAPIALISRDPLPLACRPSSERLSYDSTAPPACEPAV